LLSILLIFIAIMIFVFKRSLTKLLLENFTLLKNSKNPNKEKFAKYIINTASLLLIFIGILYTFVLIVPSNQYAQFNKKLGGPSLKDGKIIATDGEMGPQAFIVREGFHLMPFVRIFYDVEFKKVINVPEGSLLTLTAKDGLPLGNNEYFAPDWYQSYLETIKKAQKPKWSKEEYEKKMLDAKFFLTHGGKKGPQVVVLKPGKYVLNSNLWDWKIASATVIPAGFVGVVTSRVGKIYKENKTNSSSTKISVPLVPKGYIGVWKDVLTPGNYYLNPNAYHITKVDMKAQVWKYKGGFKPRKVSIYIDSKGDIIQQKETTKELPILKEYASPAIAVKTKDKYTVYVELRMQIQPDPNYAAAIVAGIGSLDMVEDKVVTPAVRAVLRNLGQNYNAVDFVNKRSEIERLFRQKVVEKTIEAGVPAKEVFFGEIDLPPAVTLPEKIEELSKKMQKAYAQQKVTFDQLIQTNETKATADQQADLVKAKIKKEKAQYEADAKAMLGDGERRYLENIAKGQEAQKNVLGPDKTYSLQMWKATLNFLEKHPEVAKAIPTIYINKTGSNSSSSIEEGAAIFSLTQIKKSQDNLVKTPQNTKRKK